VTKNKKHLKQTIPSPESKQAPSKYKAEALVQKSKGKGHPRTGHEDPDG
jgi:hypothetical protein